MQKETEEELDLFAFVKPFDGIVWILIIGVVSIINTGNPTIMSSYARLSVDHFRRFWSLNGNAQMNRRRYSAETKGFMYCLSKPLYFGSQPKVS